MSTVLLPPYVQRNMVHAAAQVRAGELEWFDAQLKELDPNLTLVRAAEHSTSPDLVPGYWHIHRRNVIGLDTYIAITGPDGEFAEPNSGIIEQLRKDDLQRAGAWEEFEARLDREEESYRRKVLDQRAEMKDEFAGRYKAKANPGVSMADVGWKHRAGARTQ